MTSTHVLELVVCRVSLELCLVLAVSLVSLKEVQDVCELLLKSVKVVRDHSLDVICRDFDLLRQLLHTNKRLLVNVSILFNDLMSEYF